MKLDELFREVFNLEQTVAVEDLKSGDIEEWDSLGHLNLVTRIEDEYKISISFEDMLEFESFQQIKKILESKNIQL